MAHVPGQDRDVHLDSDFFDDLGGGSLTAVQIIADVRTQYGIALPPTSIFRHRSVRELSKVVRAAVATLGADAGTAGEAAAVEHEGPPAKSQMALPTLITQLLPLAVLPTVFRLGQFACWILLWWYLRADLGLRGAWVMFAALAAAGAVRSTLGPLAAIALKWILVGRYRCGAEVFVDLVEAGQHVADLPQGDRGGRHRRHDGAAPLWGHRYLRWWLVRQMQVTAGLACSRCPTRSPRSTIA
jgi:acyl carrier protein